jgi:hypothetical protein
MRFCCIQRDGKGPAAENLDAWSTSPEYVPWSDDEEDLEEGIESGVWGGL